MFEDEQEMSELDIESRTWNKLQKNIKSIGFREGVVKGKELSLQEGFNLGYLEGFKMGECLGKIKGILSGGSELKLTQSEKISLNKEALNSLSRESCILCLKERTSSTDKMHFEKFEDLISTQLNHSNEMMKTLKKLDLHDLKSQNYSK